MCIAKKSGFKRENHKNNTTFAAAMQSEELLTVNLSRFPEEGIDCEFTLKDDFFARLEQEEILGGDLCVRMVARMAAGDAFTFRFSVKGKVTVGCDRCLDPVMILVDVTDEVKLRYAEADASVSPDYIDIDPRKASYDLSWELYEIIETSLPLRRVHAEGGCNNEVTEYILEADDEADGENE